MDKDSLLRLIEEFFVKLMYKAKLGSTVNDHASKVKAEQKLKRTLEIVFECDLVNCGREKSNFPGIDLIDKEKRIGFQVTADTSNKKVQDTINQCTSAENREKCKIDRVIFIFLLEKGKRKYTKIKNSAVGNFRFDQSTDVYDLLSLFKEINYLDNKADIEKIYNSLNQEFDNNAEHFQDALKIHAVNKTFSPYWEIVNSDMNLSFHPKCPDAHEIQPLEIKVAVQFDETPESRKESQQLQDFFDKGYACRIERTRIVGIEFPDFVPDYLKEPNTTQSIELHPFVDPNYSDKELRVVLLDKDGNELSSQEIVLKVEREGRLEIELSNKQQETCIKINITTSREPFNTSFEFNLDRKGYKVKELKKGIEFFNNLRICTCINFYNSYTDKFLFSENNPNKGEVNEFMKNLEQAYKALFYFEKTYPVEFKLPDAYFPPETINKILQIYQLVTTGYSIHKGRGLSTNINNETIANVYPAPVAYLTIQSYENQKIELFGCTFEIGELMEIHPPSQISKASFDKAKQFLAHNPNESINVTFDFINYNKIWTFAKDYHKLEIEFEFNELRKYVLQHINN